MRKTYIKPEVELVKSIVPLPLCASVDPKGTVNTLFGSELPPEQFGNDAWVLEGWTDYKKQFDENFDAIEIEGDNAGTIFSR